MLKPLEQFTNDEGSVELFQTRHTGPDFHVRYGLEITHHEYLDSARNAFEGCVEHLRRLANPEFE